MAARGGPRASGSDGGDFGHRETVASHYLTSAVNKRRLSTTLLFHSVLTLYEVIKLSSEMLQHFNIQVEHIHSISLPKSVIWEWVWLSSLLFAIPAHFALKKNNATALKVFVGGIFVCGIIPLLGAIMYLSSDLRTYIELGSSSDTVEKFNGVPVILISCIFIMMAFLTHSLSIVFAMNLVDAWSAKKGKKA